MNKNAIYEFEVGVGRQRREEKALPYTLSSYDNTEFLFPEVQITAVGKTGNPEYLAVLEVVEPLNTDRYINIP